ncbi:hypothetical protein GN156_07505 [bacterium LRH843]|nr:hypothetical protein [bacterium LRH843]
MMFSLIILIPFIIIAIIFIFLVGGQKTKSEEEGKEMLKNAYVYLVLFATLMMSIGGSIGVFMALADVVSPAPYHQSFEEYKQWGAPEVGGKNGTEVKTEEELRASYDAMIARELEQTKQRSMNALIKSFGWIIIPLPVFIYFQRRLGKKESSF